MGWSTKERDGQQGLHRTVATAALGLRGSNHMSHCAHILFLSPHGSSPPPHTFSAIRT